MLFSGPDIRFSDFSFVTESGKWESVFIGLSTCFLFCQFGVISVLLHLALAGFFAFIVIVNLIFWLERCIASPANKKLESSVGYIEPLNIGSQEAENSSDTQYGFLSTT